MFSASYGVHLRNLMICLERVTHLLKNHLGLTVLAQLARCAATRLEFVSLKFQELINGMLPELVL